jgi:hypothetical protein
MTALFLSVVYFLGALVRFGGSPSMAAVFSLTSHLVLFMGVFAVMNLIRAVAALFPSPGRAELALVTAGAVAALAAVLKHLVLGAMSLSGHPGLAIAVAAALVASHVGLACRLSVENGVGARSGIEVLLAPLAPGRDVGWLARGALLFTLAVAATGLASAASAMDWNFLLQKLSALAIWSLRVARVPCATPALPPLCHSPRVAARGGRGPRGCIAFVGLCNATAGAQKLERELDRYVGRDPSFQGGMGRVEGRSKGARTRDDADFYRYLQAHTQHSAQRSHRASRRATRVRC